VNATKARKGCITRHLRKIDLRRVETSSNQSVPPTPLVTPMQLPDAETDEQDRREDRAGDEDTQAERAQRTSAAYTPVSTRPLCFT
jgi:hypothetical protein